MRAAYAQYGGTYAADNSGVLQYVSIRHGGAEIGAGNEINGLTLGGVGNGTTIDHIEIFANKDDGIEFFGGSVNAKHLIVAYVGAEDIVPETELAAWAEEQAALDARGEHFFSTGRFSFAISKRA